MNGINLDSREVTLAVDGNTGSYSLEQLGGTSLAQVEVFKGFVVWPEGIYAFEVKAVKEDVKDTKEGVTCLVVILSLTCLDAQLKDSSIDKQEFIGKEFYENIWMLDVKRDFGKLKAFLVESGFSAGGGTLKEEMERFGQSKHRMLVQLKTTVDRNDKSKKYTNVFYGEDGIRPLQQAQAQAQAQQQVQTQAPAPSLTL